MNSVKVWDLPVRLFHWSLVAAFATAYLSGENELWIHEYAGYTVLALLAFRLVWGFVGTRYARFSSFIYGPRDITIYLRSLLRGKPQHYLGHNPAGGWMVIALLATLAVAGISGWQLDAAEDRQAQSAPVAASATTAEHITASDEPQHTHRHGESAWEEVHEVAVNLSLILVIVHVLGVIASSYLHKEALVKAMITGRKKH